MAFANAIDTLLKDKEKNRMYAVNGKNRVLEYFTIPKMIDKMEQCYNELL